jgi:hypothetical protein
MANKKFPRNMFSAGSALILAVVLTTLLAVVAVLFLMAARVEKTATSAISENKQLDFAVDTVITKISQELILDTPGVTKDGEYSDYPGPNDIWLASLEPYEKSGKYTWRQISDVTGYIGKYILDVKDSWDTNDIEVKIVGDHEGIDIDEYGYIAGNKGQLADADGDGVADSKWIVLDDITSSKGKPIYAAIRIVDNGAMLNVNTAYKFDINDIPTNAKLIDGSSQMQINLAALSQRGSNGTLYKAADDLQKLRCGHEPADNISEYEKNVVWRYYYSVPNGKKYTPFDISDELELRNRFLLNHQYIKTRIEDEDKLWKKAYCYVSGYVQFPYVPRTDKTDLKNDPCYWFWRANNSAPTPDYYDYRHISTTLNADKLLDPNGQKMLYVNTIDKEEGLGSGSGEQAQAEKARKLYKKLLASIDANNMAGGKTSFNYKDARSHLAHLAVNLIDFADDDDADGVEVTAFDPNNDKRYYIYGFEAQPFITEVAFKINMSPSTGLNYYALELYNPFSKPIKLDELNKQFTLIICERGTNPASADKNYKFDLTGTIRENGFFVISNALSKFSISSDAETPGSDLRYFNLLGAWKPAGESMPPPPPPLPGRKPNPDESQPPVYIGWTKRYDVYLTREVETAKGGTKVILYVDRQEMDPSWALAGDIWSYERDVRDWHIVYQNMYRAGKVGSLGRKNTTAGSTQAQRFREDFSFFLPNPLLPPEKIITIGDIAQILTIGPSEDYTVGPVGQQLSDTQKNKEYAIRLDLENPYYRNIFQYLTAVEPTHCWGDGIIQGRININTAPWYVIARLPWMTNKDQTPRMTTEKARAIVAYRDKLKMPVDYSNGRYNAIKSKIDSSFKSGDIREKPGFESIGELNFVLGGNDKKYSMEEYALDGKDLVGFPDLTTNGVSSGDGIIDDFEERDVIFARISNLAAVRSDVFTAYILVRIGANGPQKRVIAILDRSDVRPDGSRGAVGNVKTLALHPVPDPR